MLVDDKKMRKVVRNALRKTDAEFYKDEYQHWLYIFKHDQDDSHNHEADAARVAQKMLDRRITKRQIRKLLKSVITCPGPEVHATLNRICLPLSNIQTPNDMQRLLSLLKKWIIKNNDLIENGDDRLDLLLENQIKKWAIPGLDAKLRHVELTKKLEMYERLYGDLDKPLNKWAKYSDEPQVEKRVARLSPSSQDEPAFKRSRVDDDADSEAFSRSSTPPIHVK